MIVIPEQGDAQHRLWCDLMGLAEAFPGTWTIIGAHMVALHCWEAGIRSRPSEDIDVLANVRLSATSARDIARYLMDREYAPEITRDGVAHRFAHGLAGASEVRLIDLFVPDGVGPRAPAVTVPPHRTIAVPGGTQALRRSSPVAIRSRDVEGTVMRPDILGALIVKLRAIDVDDVPDAQRSDVALLLGLIADPDALRPLLDRSDKRVLARHGYFANRHDPRWRTFDADDSELVELVYRRLLG